ncbi:MAG: hypothetical protein C5B49_02705 [Bdellovibrio sp.]|nr:MAG: hypothetical protein C5B49_02705 [Bdellovibrio sp.]
MFHKITLISILVWNSISLCQGDSSVKTIEFKNLSSRQSVKLSFEPKKQRLGIWFEAAGLHKGTYAVYWADACKKNGFKLKSSDLKSLGGELVTLAVEADSISYEASTDRNVIRGDPKTLLEEGVLLLKRKKGVFQVLDCAVLAG